MHIPKLLEIGKYHLSHPDAENAVIDALKQLGFHKSPKQSWGEVEITITEGERSSKYKFHELVKKARLSGIAQQFSV